MVEWKYITRIGISGTHNCGKTTLMNALTTNDQFNDFAYVTGIADRYNREDRKQMLTQECICNDIIASETSMHTDGISFIHDRTLADNLAYSRALYAYGDDQTKKTRDIFKRIESKVYNYFNTNPYDLVIFIDEYFPIEDNGTRCTSEKTQVFVYRFLKSFYDALEKNMNNNDKHLDIIRISGSTESRIDQVINHVRKR